MKKLLNYTYKIAKAIPALNTHLSSNYSTISENKFQNQVYNVSNIILSPETIEAYLQKFWDDIMKPLSKSQNVSLIFKVRYEDNQPRTLAPRQEINKSSFNDLLDLISYRLSKSTDSYSSTPIIEIIFFYRINEGEINPSITKDIKSVPNYQIYYKNKLPIAYKTEDYGDFIKRVMFLAIP